MASLKIRRFDCTGSDGQKQLNKLRDHFHHHSETLSPRAKKLSQLAFGEVLWPTRAVERICQDVREQGLKAVLRYTEVFDKVKLTPQTVRVSAEELAAARAEADPELLATIQRIRHQLLSFQTGLIHSNAVLPYSGSHELHLRYRPIRRVGVCVPGGVAAYPSSLLMTVCPAQAAGVKEIAVVMPPTPTGGYSKLQLAVCHELGISEVYRIGGAQAVAALAFGAEVLQPVDMIVGPGNSYVTLAKKFVFGQVAIDCLAGPSEVVVIADQSAQPEFVAADLLAQAEHSGDARAVLVTWHAELLNEVSAAIERQLEKLQRNEIAHESLERYGALALVRDSNQAVELTNALAPEHLHVQTRDPEEIADRIDNAGAIFVGALSPVALGDYAAGPSHVLPTGGTARFASGLNVNDFLRRTSVIHVTTKAGLKSIAEDVIFMAEVEGLTAHARSVKVRLDETAKLPARPPRSAEKTRR